MDASLVHQIVTTLQQHQPWMADKAGGALVVQGVRELWDLTKKKLGSGSTEKIEKHPDEPAQWELFRAKLLVALDEDPEFCDKMQSIAQNVGICLHAEGDNNNQVAVSNSQDVKISIASDTPAFVKRRREANPTGTDSKTVGGPN
jgi:hypothetical protein